MTEGRKRTRRVLRLVALGILGVICLVVGAGLIGYDRLRASLPRLDGEMRLEGLSAPVTLERDDLGIPTIRGSDRIDVARATGFAHAQDRFFQMDLLRRRSAGELAELLGPALVETDLAIRRHRFRSLAGRMIGRAGPETRTLLDAYTAGVNAGLGSLRARPFEYLLLRSQPRPWSVEDTLLVVLAMYVDLQDETGRLESTIGVMRDVLPEALFEFLVPWVDEWDAPLIDEPIALPPWPDLAPFDLREVARTDTTEPFAGSNNWAVSGELTAGSSAMLANDMHLPHGLPNLWYRASLIWPDGRGGLHRVTGVTLPGTPTVIAGSNGNVAWGFTNSYGDFADLVEIEPGPEAGLYRTAEGLRAFETFRETIAVRGEADRIFEPTWTVWGPLIDVDHRGRRRALRWVAHDDSAVNFGLLEMEIATGLEEALEIATRTAIPAQNVAVADRTGRIGWTVAGRIPRRFGLDGRSPTSWADGSRGWDGHLDPAEIPRIVDPPSGRIWTANNRVVSGEALERIGDGGYALGARARQIRDALGSLERIEPEEMLAIQLDDRALFLERWRTLLLETLERMDPDPRRDELRRLVDTEWTGRASVDSAAYRMVRAYRGFVVDRLIGGLTAPCVEADPGFRRTPFRRWESPVWRLIERNERHAEALAAATNDVIATFARPDEPLAARTWGERNTVTFRHPLSNAVPVLGRWIDLRETPLAGDTHLPRVQSPGFGASQRMVVSPGEEERGLFHMPGGQSGHPLSPYFARGHEAWVDGEPTGFLPGPAVHTLVLAP